MSTVNSIDNFCEIEGSPCGERRLLGGVLAVLSLIDVVTGRRWDRGGGRRWGCSLARARLGSG
ncbi:hypothetical protein [Rhodococcus erythropolis]|uniref:hypothetical protein n=1 Tax=Rhodococcus erythropolis TaxID=1833 RepID=UPI001BE90EBA|nr:hypothetical protein [Rhodococcus erythropolis]MBT2269872.1 hypothetical protein [Rhodococcus erythropolis]